MILKDWAEKNGLTLDEAKLKTGLTHWKQHVVDVVEDVVHVAEVVAEEASKVVEQNEDLIKIARALQGPCGFKTMAYLEFVYENRETIKDEYLLVKTYIEKLLCKN